MIAGEIPFTPLGSRGGRKGFYPMVAHGIYLRNCIILANISWGYSPKAYPCRKGLGNVSPRMGALCRPCAGRGSKHHCRCPLTGTPPLRKHQPLASIGNFPPIAIPASPLLPVAGMAGGRFWGSLRAKQDGAREHFRWVQ